VLELLDQLNRDGLTLITVTHDVAVASHARRVLVLEDGKIVRRLVGEELTKLSELLAFAPTLP
jgi:ABC-type lipoprotein export system ATPase subunit